MPVYNEEENLENVLKNFLPKLVDCLFIVNDCSTDKIPIILKKFKEKNIKT